MSRKLVWVIMIVGFGLYHLPFVPWVRPISMDEFIAAGYWSAACLIVHWLSQRRSLPADTATLASVPTEGKQGDGA